MLEWISSHSIPFSVVQRCLQCFIVAYILRLFQQSPQVSAAEIVRAAAENKKNEAVKEERVEKEPEKPSWLVEAEARRKLHEQRRRSKARQHKETNEERDKPLNDVILHPVAQRSQPETVNSDKNGVALRSVAHRSEPVVGKSESSRGNVLHNVVLSSARKPEPVLTKSEGDSDVSRTTLNFCLRPVSKPEPVATQSKEENDSDSIKPHSVFLRPTPKPEPTVNNDKTDDLHGKFQLVRLKPIVYPMGARSSGAKAADSERAPVAEVETPSKPYHPLEIESSSSTVADTEITPIAIRTSSEVTTSSSPAVEPVMQSFSHTVTSSRVRENGETSSGTAKTSPEYHIVRSLAPITSENPTITRSEPKVAEASPSHTSRLNGGSRVTVSSNYVSAPHKVAPKTKPKPTIRSKTVTVTASEVPDPSSVRRKSIELIHAKVEWKGLSKPPSAIPAGHVVSHNTMSHGDLRAPRRKGGDLRDMSDTYDSSYRPTYTGDVLPQWKIDLIERKKNTAPVQGV